MRGRHGHLPALYEGTEPYLFLCFSPADVASVKPLAEALARRGVRVWYPSAGKRDLASRDHDQGRIEGASLIVAYLGPAALDDTAVKGTILYCQDRAMPIIVIDAQDVDSRLSMGLTDQVHHLAAWQMDGPEAIEDGLVHTPGFTQDLIGEQAGETSDSGRRRLALTLLAAALAVIVVGGIAGAALGWFSPGRARPTDTVTFQDRTLTAAARTSLGGGDLTEESLATITSLRLSKLPDNLSDLERFPSLKRLRIPQTEADRATDLLDDAPYDIVLEG